jgi:TctA family transporter
MGATGVGVGVGVGVTVGVGVGITSGVGEGVGVGLTTGTTFTPLFHTSFFPDLMQVYFTPLYVEVIPALVQLCPAFTAAEATVCAPIKITAKDSPSANLELCFIDKACSQIHQI